MYIIFSLNNVLTYYKHLTSQFNSIITIYEYLMYIYILIKKTVYIKIN